jgi:transcriptional regulator with XRE-family HTH domain
MALTYELIGQKLKKAREATGFTQSQVATYLGVHRENISYFETGARPIDTITLSKLADLYGYLLSYFLAAGESDDNQTVISAAFRKHDLTADDLATIAWAKKFARNLGSVKRLLGE